MTKEIKGILENVIYWDTCPDDYKDKIKSYLSSEPQQEALNLPVVSGSALEADYWSERCKLAESIWENSNVEYIDKELADLEKEYHVFIKDNGSKHYR